jgi:YHS domain-containing protein
MVVAQEHAIVCSDYRSKHYCFCSEECKEEFDTDPETYVAESAEGAYEEEEAL